MEILFQGCVIRIAFFSRDLPSDCKSGVALQVHRLANALVGRSHAVTCFSFSPRPVDACYTHKHLSKRFSGITAKIWPAWCFRKQDKNAFDIIHFHGDDYLSNGTINRVRTFYGSAWFEFLHATSLRRKLYQLLFYFFECVSCRRRGRLVAISNHTRKALPRISTIIPCGVDTTVFTSGKGKTVHPSILMVGFGGERKGGVALISQFSSVVLPEFPAAVLYVVGPKKVSGTNIVWLRTVCEAELIMQYQQAWVYCMSSTYEGFGVPILEAWACGTPVVATQNAGACELITHNQNGLLCTPQALGKTLSAVIGDGVLRLRLIQNGLQSVAPYDITRIAARYEELYAAALTPQQ